MPNIHKTHTGKVTEVLPRRPKAESGFIYFVTDGEAVKVGFASDVTKRVRGLQTSHHWPLFLLGSFKAKRQIERVLHERFEKHRLIGEWFKPDPEICQFIDELEAQGRLIAGDDEDSYALKLP